jgi:hypothetical protein
MAGRMDHARVTTLRQDEQTLYHRIVSRLESIVEELRSLPPAKLEAAADFVHRPKRISEEERKALLIQTCGSLSGEDADAMERAIEEGCECSLSPRC